MSSSSWRKIDRCLLEINKVTGLGLTLAIAATS